MPSVNEKLSNRAIRHQAYIGRLTTHQANLAKERLNDYKDEIIAAILAAIIDTPLGLRLNEAELRRNLNHLFQAIIQNVNDNLSKRLDKIVDNEAEFVLKLYQKVLDEDLQDPTGQITLAFEGAMLYQWLQVFANKSTDKLIEAVREQIEGGASQDEIEDTMRFEKWNDRENSLGTIVTTFAFVASHSAWRRLFDANRRLWKGWWIHIVLDSHTCLRCIARYEKNPYPYHNHPIAGFHFLCRCFGTPIYKNGGEILDEDYESWLKKQPKDVQQDILGKQKWQWWKAGKADVTDFTVNGRRLTLDEIRRREDDILSD